MNQHRPIVILGAARSGTKFLRSVLAASQHTAESPYDINYVWRYGNEDLPHDAIPADAASEKVTRFIHRQLRRSAGVDGTDGRAIVEKTVSNVLRVPFVQRVLPDARFVFLIRDGRDVAESAMRCWSEPPKLGYLRHKLATYPWAHCGPYAVKHLARTAVRAVGLSSTNRSWGPRYPGIDYDLTRNGLAYVCAKQWLACVETYERDRHALPSDACYEVRYEDLARAPFETTLRLTSWLGLPDAEHAAEYAKQNALRSRMGLGNRLKDLDKLRVDALLMPALTRWGYLTEHARRAA